MDAPIPPKAVTRRVDAERNRDQILAAAREAFADPDADVSMAEVSRRAGVGSATLYRNFANRRELLEALYLDEIDAVCAAAERTSQDGPGSDLRAWLEHFFIYFVSKRLVASELLEHTDASAPFFSAGRDRVLEAGGRLLRAAQDEGQVRGDLELSQVLDMVAAIAKIPGDAERRQPILKTALDGLHASAAT